MYCTADPDISKSDIDCKIVSPEHAHPSANGALLVDDGKTLLVNDVVEATTTVYDVDPETKMLSVRKKVVCSLLPIESTVGFVLFSFYEVGRFA